MDYLIITAVILAVIILIGWLFWRNQKDRKHLERKLNRSETNPEKHKKDQV